MTIQSYKAPADAQSNVALNGLRALVALAIMTSHWSEGLGLQSAFMPQNGLCVDFFFAIEGYLTAAMLSAQRPDVRLESLLAQQYIKILPLHWLSLLAGFLFVTALGIPLVALGHAALPSTTLGISGLVNGALLPVFLGPWESVFVLNPPAWAIVLEIFAFGGLCLIRPWLNLRTALATSFIGAIVYIGMALYFRDINLGFKTTGYWGGWPRCVFGFCGGASLFFFLRRFGPILPKLHPVLIWAVFLAVPFISVRRIGIPLVLVAMPLIVWAAAVSASPLWLRTITDQARRITYALYLIPFPVMAFFRFLFPENRMPHTLSWYGVYYAMILVTVIVLAYFATRMITEPLSRLLTSRAASTRIKLPPADGADRADEAE